MVSENRHIVNRVNATINCRKNQLSEIQRRDLASNIESAVEALLPFLDKKFGTEKIVQIEALTVMLQVDKGRLSDLGKLLTKALSDLFTTLETEKHALPHTVYQEAKAYTPEEVLFYFLKNGQMPWFSEKLEWEKIDGTNVTLKIRLTELLKSSPQARERFIDQCPDAQLVPLLSSLYPGSYIKKLFDFTHLILQNIEQFSKRFAAGFRIRQKMIKAALDHIQEMSGKKSFINFLKNYWPLFLIEMEKECNGRHLDFLRFLQANANLKLEFGLPSEKYQAPNSVSKDSVVSLQPKTSLSEEEEIPGAIFNKEKLEAQQMVANAGIVLLHPFIKRFFIKVGLLENDRFISIEHQQRGICLLHYLATGETVFPEEKLALQKHLCNYPLYRSIPRELPISEFERTETNTVLEAAIQHWGALKGTSTAGLQINFLQRKGLLEKDALGHALHVESHAVDVLLDRLPWALSTVHLPWLPDLLTVKWR